jgi:hypothetical protein
MPKCPYFENACEKVKKVNCRRGAERTSFQGKGYSNQLNQFCNNSYRLCWCYTYLERAW